MSGLQATVAPAKAQGIFTTRDFAPEELVLVPLTTSIVIKGLAINEPPVGAVCIGTYKNQATNVTNHVALMRSGGLKSRVDKGNGTYDYVAPLWLVKISPAGAPEPNMFPKAIKLVNAMTIIPALSNKKFVPKGTELISRSLPQGKHVMAAAKAAAAMTPPSKRAKIG